ncbi:OmpP1/FadL family transporter [Pontibacter liquoris]|uniref:OmpP1/FadL family transporter n=1 Tax=Pontibacter liquoris TaxID=2905677 RepID=UPI001FA81639|nr:outer membrane protein transport protein [Pontibacter liquoris]
MYKKLRVLIGFALLCMAPAAQAQYIGNTPYSRYGLGEINSNLGNIRNAGMAGAGISAANSFQANIANPALLYYNSITVFDMSIRGQVKTLSDGNASQRDGNASLSNLSLVVPVSKRWSSAVSLRPFSDVTYEMSSSMPLESNPRASILRGYEGDGGLSELSFSNGVKIVKGLTVGATASYIFGNVTKEASSLVQDDSLSTLSMEQVVYSERTRYQDFLFRAGVNYRQELKESLFLSIGGTYSFESDLNANRKNSYERRTIYEGILDQNIMPDSTKGSVLLPQSWQAGISLDNGSNMTLVADFSAQQWSKFRNFDGDKELADSYRAALGGEYTPDAKSIGNYFKRITYRGGLYYGKTPYEINGTQIGDKGVTVGFTLPIGRSTVYDMYQLNTAFGYGQRGTTSNGLIAEKYFQFSAGITINSRWFIKRRIE